ncbi:MAG: hypothetical protein DI535_17890 [Citrobacter freundii]|nr:MAG: hypothetical protein DI535_17890 [Citrobacter freundii]
MKEPIHINGLASLQAELNRLKLEARAVEKELLQQGNYCRNHFISLCWNSMKRRNRKEEESDRGWNKITGPIINSIINWIAGKSGRK